MTVKMLGSHYDPTLAAKAKECEGMLPFVVDLLSKYRYKFATNPLNLLRTEWLIAAGGQGLNDHQSGTQMVRG